MERSEIRGRCTRRCCGRPRITLVESRMGAVAWAIRHRPVSHPRSSNRTCGFPASGFPTGFIVDSQTHAPRPLESHHPHRTEHPFLRELAGALRRHLVTPPQKVPHFVIDMLLNRPVGLARGTAAEVCSPAFQYLIQPLAHLFPWVHVARHQQLSHFRLDPGHALLQSWCAGSGWGESRGLEEWKNGLREELRNKTYQPGHHQLFEWVLPPLVICPFGAHALVPGMSACATSL